MASGNSTRGQRVLHQTASTALSSAAAEWILMLLLFVDGLYSYLVTKFAHYFKLQKPCLFCSRLDHILGHERPGFYKDLICHTHKLEISSSAFCHIHEKLADVQDMCEACLFSFATENKSNSETYRSLVGKLGRNLDISENAHLRQLAPVYPDELKVKFEEEDVVQEPLLQNQTLDHPITRYCSCCHMLFINKPHAHRLLQTKSIGTGHQELDVVLFGQSGDDSLQSGDGSGKRREKSFGAAASHIENQNLGSLSHIGYTELKDTSDSESEVLLSDEDDGSTPVGTDDMKVDMLSQSLEQEPFLDSKNQNVLPRIYLHEIAPVKQIHPTLTLTESSCLLPVEQIHPVEHHDGDMLSQSLEQEPFLDSENQNVLPKIVLDEIAPEKQIHPTPTLTESSCLLPVEQIHSGEHHEGDMLSQSLEQGPFPDSENQNVLPKIVLDEIAPEKQIHPTPTLTESSCLLPVEQIHPVERDGDSLVPRSTIEHVEELTWNEFKEKGQTSPTSKLISEIPDPHLDDAEVTHVEDSVATTGGHDHPPVLDKVISEVSDLKLDEVGTVDPALVSSATNMEEPKNLNSTEMGLRQIQTTSDPGSLMLSHMDLNDAYRMAISYRMNQPSPRDSYRVHEDLRSLLSQLSATRGLEFPWSDITPSPRLYGQGDDMKMSDASSTTSQQNLHKRLSIERNESGFESLDGSIVSEVEGESPVDRFRRQVELDRKSMSLLYKELEEERNASAIAANQAMAMITRLQEEKASMQMEALQYQRMMEEQAEYDQEVLQKSNDLLAQKEEELQDLKAEIESYKKWLGVESSPTEMKVDLEQKEDTVCRPLVKPSDGKKILERKDTVFLDAEGDKGAISKNPILGFDDEKLYISECLKNLERKLHLFSNNGVHHDVSASYARDDILPVHVIGNGHLLEKDTSELSNLEEEGSQLEEDTVLNQKAPSFDGEDSHLNGELTNKETHNAILKIPKSEGENQQSDMISRRADLVDIENELLHLNHRLEALEADRSFLEHTLNSLRSGNDGIQLVQEIASDLQELRRIGVRRKEQTTT
ncbi:hypothetical protein Taro_028824 [Colocasia esculenta]|uniref:GTD-binding domain-containing protein n=1 Tax=Colocasia esculenta TaxID=4460 RepID=A0A843VCA4_COLES|nr:hypothetical protein [Colocasia esculenta]